MPRMEPLTIILSFSLLNLLTTVFWFSLDQTSQQRFKWSVACGSLSLWGILLAFVQGFELSQTQAKNFYYNQYSWNMGSDGAMTFRFPLDPLDFWKVAPGLPTIERHYGPYQVIDFVPKPDVKAPEARSWMMTMDGRFQLSSLYERAYHETFAHLPSGIEGRVGPRILIVGGGDGLLARELLRFEDEVKQITLVDIDPMILQLSREHPLLLDLNQRSLLHPKVSVEVRDAFTYLRRFQGEFDRIYLDILYPYNFESSRLYSVEFMALVRQHLTADGQLVMLSPLDFDQETRPDEDRTTGTILSTIHEAGFVEAILFAEERHSFLMARSRPGELPEWDVIRTSPYFKTIFPAEVQPRYRRLPYYRDMKLVNSVLKPTFMGQKDSFF